MMFDDTGAKALCICLSISASRSSLEKEERQQKTTYRKNKQLGRLKLQVGEKNRVGGEGNHVLVRFYAMTPVFYVRLPATTVHMRLV